MDGDVEEMMVRVRADTAAFRRDVEEMRGALDGPLAQGVERAGRLIDRSLMRAIRTGKFGFDELKRVALTAFGEIAAAALKTALPGGQAGGAGGIGAALLQLLGVPGRAHGGAVQDGRPYLVGERGPELFVPSSAGRVETLAPAAGAVNVNVSLRAPAAEREAPVLARSQRQIGHAVRRAMREGGR